MSRETFSFLWLISSVIAFLMLINARIFSSRIKDNEIPMYFVLLMIGAVIWPITLVILLYRSRTTNEQLF